LRNAVLACLEQAPDNLRLLRRNFALNGVCATVIAAAVDANDRPLQLKLQSRDYEHKIVPAWRQAEFMYGALMVAAGQS
jgi:tRNA G37 N-methylase Trm5